MGAAIPVSKPASAAEDTDSPKGNMKTSASSSSSNALSIKCAAVVRPYLDKCAPLLVAASNLIDGKAMIASSRGVHTTHNHKPRAQPRRVIFHSPRASRLGGSDQSLLVFVNAARGGKARARSRPTRGGRARMYAVAAYRRARSVRAQVASRRAQ